MGLTTIGDHTSTRALVRALQSGSPRLVRPALRGILPRLTSNDASHECERRGVDIAAVFETILNDGDMAYDDQLYAFLCLAVVQKMEYGSAISLDSFQPEALRAPTAAEVTNWFVSLDTQWPDDERIEAAELLTGAIVARPKAHDYAAFVPRLVFLLRSRDPRLCVAATRAIIVMGAAIPSQIESIVDHGAVHLLTNVMRSGGHEQKAAAAEALRTLASKSATARLAMVSAGAIPPLMEVVHSGVRHERLEAAAALALLKHKDLSEQEVAAARGIVGPLTELMTSGSEKQRAHACLIVARVVTANHEDYAAVFAQTNLVDSVVGHFRSSSSKRRTIAACAVGEVGEFAAFQDALVCAGVVEPLVEMLRTGDTHAKVAAATAVVKLAYASSDHHTALATAIPLLVEIAEHGPSEAVEAAGLALLVLAGRVAWSLFTK